MPEILIFFTILLVATIWFAAMFNRFVRLRRHIDESWSNVDIELKRRHDLIPNLVDVVRSYATHEKVVLEQLVTLRAEAMAERGRAAIARRERDLEQGLAGVFAVVEDYPRLQSDAQFLALQKQLALTEDRIAAARRFYNGNVRDSNSLCEQFPANVVASMFGFRIRPYFELGDPAKRRTARVDLAP